MTTLFDAYTVPLDRWIQDFIEWLVHHYRPVFQAVRWPIQALLDGVQKSLTGTPEWIVILLVFAAGWRAASWRVGAFGLIAMASIGIIGLWSPAMTTLSIVATAVAFAFVVGVPIGVLAAQSEKAWAAIRPILDVMQSTPSFVYLVPVVMLFGVGTVPGVIATIVFCLPPVIRLTNVGLRQVPGDVVEAGQAFGATGYQMLRDVKLPLALPIIMTGLNQSLMFAMVMSVIAAMIGTEGLGLVVLRGIGRLDVGLAAVGGIAIVLMAMTLDRITQEFGNQRREARVTGFARLRQLNSILFVPRER